MGQGVNWAPCQFWMMTFLGKESRGKGNSQHDMAQQEAICLPAPCEPPVSLDFDHANCFYSQADHKGIALVHEHLPRM